MPRNSVHHCIKKIKKWDVFHVHFSLCIHAHYSLIISWLRGITRRLREKLVLPSSLPKDISPSYRSLVHVLAWKSTWDRLTPSSEASSPKTSTSPAFTLTSKVIPDSVHLRTSCPLNKENLTVINKERNGISKILSLFPA